MMESAASPSILVVTPTYDRPGRIALLQRCVEVFREIAGLHWIVVEDGALPDPAVAHLLATSGILHTLLAHGPTRAWGNAGRDTALRHIRDHALPGIVYLADDDNYYERPLFAELRRVKHVGVLPVGLLGPSGIERPILGGGRIVGWSAHWKSRQFPIDMAGFAFDATLLQGFAGPIWTYRARGGESEFLERLVNSADQLEILCDGCRCCHVWHDLPLGKTPKQALAAYRWRRRKDFIIGRILRPLLASRRRTNEAR
jgi:galactosylgalactosylxylosylprotein 3-beta-glucuronosyltransferase 3